VPALLFDMMKYALLLVLGLAHAFEVIPDKNVIELHLKASYGVTDDNMIVNLAEAEKIQLIG
jgi:hypothetical protein